MEWHNWTAFMLATFVICGSPGPNMLHVMHSSVSNGFRASLASMAGCFLAVIMLIFASVAGVGIILAASPVLFNVLRYFGAAYLLYLGVQAWRAPVNPDHAEEETKRAMPSFRILFRKGFMVGMSNPKALLFAAAFFPQFINPHAAQLPQLVMLFISFSVLEIGWYLSYAFGGRKIASLLQRASVRRIFNRMTGGIFALFGLALAAKSA